MSSRKPTARPIIVEIRPDDAPSSSIAPSTPPLAKAVRFAPPSDDRFSRPLSYAEAWSLYYFEEHARQCPTCFKPLEVYRRGGRLCEVGHGLAQDVACHVYYRDGEIYSCNKDDVSKLVRVEIPHGYAETRGLLRAMEHRLRRSHRTVPVYSYDRSYPVAARYVPSAERKVTIESSPNDRRGSKYVRYTTVPIDEYNDEPKRSIPVTTTTATSASRRGSLYDKDMHRKQKDYRLEVSDARKERRRSRRDSGVYV